MRHHAVTGRGVVPSDRPADLRERASDKWAFLIPVAIPNPVTLTAGDTVFAISCTWPAVPLSCAATNLRAMQNMIRIHPFFLKAAGTMSAGPRSAVSLDASGRAGLDEALAKGRMR